MQVDERRSFFDRVTKDMEIARVTLLLTGSIEGSLVALTHIAVLCTFPAAIALAVLESCHHEATVHRISHTRFACFVHNRRHEAAS